MKQNNSIQNLKNNSRYLIRKWKIKEKGLKELKRLSMRELNKSILQFLMIKILKSQK